MRNGITRRGVIQTGAAAGVLAATGLPARAAPKKGGHLRLGLSGGNTSDSWDARKHADTFTQVMAQGCVFDTLTEVAADGVLKGELAESWEASADAKVWIFNLRKGVTFHNGKSFGADDVLESLKLHTEKDAASAAKPIVEPIIGMKKMNDHQIELTLKSGNADFPYLMSDYHIVMFPAGMIKEAMEKGIGTGGYTNDGMNPGVRFVGKKYADHYKTDSCYFDSVEIIGINDNTARMNALMTNQVDAINGIDFKSEALLKRNPNVEIFEVTGNQHYTLPMHTNTAPFDDNNVRMALKHAINRQEMVDKILLGHGAVANDHPIGPANLYYYADLEQNDFDTDKAKAYLKKSGLSSLKIDLRTSNAAFAGADDAALLFQSSAKAAGIDINVIREPSDGYWSNVWLKQPFCTSFWSGRATEDWMFSTAYAKGVPWNSTKWEHEKFNKLLLQARAELDSGKRGEMYREMQEITSKEGGMMVPMYANYVDAASTKLGHSDSIGNLFRLDSTRFIERWWFK